jgi:hypothetical protein
MDQFNQMLSELTRNAATYFPQTQAPDAAATRQGINQLRSFGATGGGGAMDVLSQYMNQGLNPNMTNYLNTLGQNMTRERQNAVNQIGAQFGRGGTAASRLAADQARDTIGQGGADMLNANMNALNQNAATRLNAASALGNMGTSLYSAPSSLEMAMLGNQRAYDLANMGQGAGLAGLLTNLLNMRGNNIYEQGTWAGQPNSAYQVANILSSLLKGASVGFNPGGAG